MKRTEPLPRGATAPERDALLDHLHDVGVRFEVLDEAGGEEGQRLLLELDDGDTAATLLGRGGCKTRDELVVAQELGDGPAELARAVAVNESDAWHFGQQRLVEKLL